MFGSISWHTHTHAHTHTCTHTHMHTHTRTHTSGGNYFSSHFNLGYRRFPSGEPEVFLFGELNDLNFLNTRPIAVG